MKSFGGVSEMLPTEFPYTDEMGVPPGKVSGSIPEKLWFCEYGVFMTL